MEQYIRVGDIGTVIKLTMYDQDGVVDLSSTTLRSFKIKDALNGVTTKSAVFETDGTDGILKYQFVSGDLDVAGIWSVQAYVEMPSGSWTSGTYEFEVHDLEIE